MRGPSPWSGNPAPSERPERYGNERKSYDDQRDSNEIGIDSRRIPEAHVDVLFVPLVARVQDQEQPDHPEKRSEEQAEESAHDLHDDECTSRPGAGSRRSRPGTSSLEDREQRDLDGATLAQRLRMVRRAPRPRVAVRAALSILCGRTKANTRGLLTRPTAPVRAATRPGTGQSPADRGPRAKGASLRGSWRWRGGTGVRRHRCLWE